MIRASAVVKRHWIWTPRSFRSSSHAATSRSSSSLVSIRRARQGLFPGERTPVDRIRLRRVEPANPAEFTCVDCAETFIAGARSHAKRCTPCARLHLRKMNRFAWRRRQLRRKGIAA